MNKIMKALDKLKKKAKKIEKSWPKSEEQVHIDSKWLNDNFDSSNELPWLFKWQILKFAQRYATECCKATLEKAKDKAVTDQSCQVWNCQGMSVNKESITSPENIILL